MLVLRPQRKRKIQRRLRKTGRRERQGRRKDEHEKEGGKRKEEHEKEDGEEENSLGTLESFLISSQM
jgi:hypothetical protein